MMHIVQELAWQFRVQTLILLIPSVLVHMGRYENYPDIAEFLKTYKRNTQILRVHSTSALVPDSPGSLIPLSKGIRKSTIRN